MNQSRTSAVASVAVAYPSIAPNHAMALLDVFRAACLEEHAHNLIPAVTSAISRLLGGLSTAMLVRDGDALTVAEGVTLTNHARHALGALGDPDEPLAQRVLNDRVTEPLKLSVRGSSCHVFPMRGGSSDATVGAVVVEMVHGESMPASAGLLAFLPQLTRDLAPVLSGALRRRDEEERADKLDATCRERGRDLVAGQHIINDLARRLVALEGSGGGFGGAVDIDQQTHTQTRGAGGRGAQTRHMADAELDPAGLSAVRAQSSS